MGVILKASCKRKVVEEKKRISKGRGGFILQGYLYPSIILLIACEVELFLCRALGRLYFQDIIALLIKCNCVIATKITAPNETANSWFHR